MLFSCQNRQTLKKVRMIFFNVLLGEGTIGNQTVHAYEGESIKARKVLAKELLERVRVAVRNLSSQ